MMETPDPLKCSTCKIIKDVCCFGRRKDRKRGYSYECKACKLLYQAGTKECECGLVVSKHNYARHLRLSRHKKAMEKKIGTITAETQVIE